MKHSHLLGNLPTRKSGMLNRLLAARKLGISKEALHKGYNNWCQTFRMKGSCLTLEQYFQKLREANITVFDLGNTSGRYQLARFNDEGPYTKDSCRFVPIEVNFSEQKRITPFQHVVNKFGYEEASRRNSFQATKGWERRRGNGTDYFPFRTHEHRKNLSIALTGRKHTEEHKTNLSISMKRVYAERKNKL
jgi:hypothetical protein